MYEGLDVMLEWQRRDICERSSYEDLAYIISEPECNRLTVSKAAGIVVELGKGHDVSKNLLHRGMPAANLNEQRLRNFEPRVGLEPRHKPLCPQISSFIILDIRYPSQYRMWTTVEELEAFGILDSHPDEGCFTADRLAEARPFLVIELDPTMDEQFTWRRTMFLPVRVDGLAY